MRLTSWCLPFALLPGMAFATTPPRALPFKDKACRATHVFTGTASEFKVVSRPESKSVPRPAWCETPGDGKSLAMCEEVEVQVSVDDVRSPTNWRPTSPITFRFGGGLFSVDQLREDLVGKRRYFFTTITDESATPVHRTSYAWFLGAPATPETDEAVTSALQTCDAKPATAM